MQLLYAVSGGKHVHANMRGDGGDIFSFGVNY
jgi:hypothetical protein